MINHDEKPKLSDLSVVELQRWAKQLSSSPYAKYVENLKSKVIGRTVVSSAVSSSGFLLYLNDNSWVLSFLNNAKLDWRVGSGEPSTADLKLMNAEYSDDGRKPLAVNLPYADETCDMEVEIAEAHGKPIVNLAIGARSFNFCFPEKRELDVMIAPDAKGQTALRVFWEQW